MPDGRATASVSYIRPDSRPRALLKCCPLLITLAEVKKMIGQKAHRHGHDVTY